MRETVAELFGLTPDAPHLEQALTHPSYANEQRDASDNQRLEFLGDSVLGFCSSELLYARFPSADEGTLTRMRARLVNADALADFARQQGIAAALRLGRGAEVSGLRERTNVLADAVEALIAAAFLDAGLDAARRACERVVAAALGSLELDAARDPKSELQERVQAAGDVPPIYEVVDSGGPAHERWFEVSARIGGREVGRGRGRSKRQAEFAAARAALEEQAWTKPAEEERNEADP
jgi:ribonuclease III